jgi:transcriptional antiterminator NusG
MDLYDQDGPSENGLEAANDTTGFERATSEEFDSDIVTPLVELDDLSADFGVPTPDEALTGEHGEGDGRAWYVVHCYSGYENKVRHNLEQRIESMGMKDEIFDVVVPTEEEIEVKEGKRRTVERRVFPGYILVNMILS